MQSIATLCALCRWAAFNEVERQICKRVQELNRQLLQHIPGRPCPFRDGQCDPLPLEPGQQGVAGGALGQGYVQGRRALSGQLGQGRVGQQGQGLV